MGTALKFPGFLYDDTDDRNKGGLTHCSHYSSTGTTDKELSYYYESQSTFNKIPLLFRVFEESPQKYDQLLILDTDTMIVDFEYDVTSLLGSTMSTSKANGVNKGEKNVFENTTKKKDNNDVDTPPFHQIDSMNNYAKHNDSPFLVAYRVHSFDWISTWDINAGILLWNLQHEKLRSSLKTG